MLLSKITHTLENQYIFRHTRAIDRTDDDFEILSVKMYSQTEFGQQGSLLCWYGGSKDFDWDNHESDGLNVNAFLFGFQNFLEFYTTPSKVVGVRKLVLYTPRDDWSGWENLVIEEIEYEGGEADDEDIDFEELIVGLLGKKYEIKKVSEDSLKKYFDE
jgi:hypothetical protein